MTRIKWDQTGERFYETGVDRGVLYVRDSEGGYEGGVPWNGLTGVTQTPTGAEPQPQYADNIKYVTLISAEEFEGTIEAFTYPDEFAQCDGTATPAPGVFVGQQPRKTFGLAYRTLVGNDVDGQEHAYKLHLIYGAMAAPSEKAHTTVNDSPEALTFSWTITADKVEVPDIEIDGVDLKPTAIVTLDSREIPEATMREIEDTLYGSDDADAVDPALPLPHEIVQMVQAGAAA